MCTALEYIYQLFYNEKNIITVLTNQSLTFKMDQRKFTKTNVYPKQKKMDESAIWQKVSNNCSCQACSYFVHQHMICLAFTFYIALTFYIAFTF